MKQFSLHDHKDFPGIGGRGRAGIAALIAALLLFLLMPGAMAESAGDLKPLLSKEPELYSYWAQQLSQPWTLKTGMRYTLRLTFEETAERSFARDGAAMTYRLPEGLALADDGQEHAFSVWAGSVLARAIWRADAEKNTVEVYWDQEGPEYERLISASSRQFSLDVPVTYQGGESMDFGRYTVKAVLGSCQKMAFGDALPENGGLVAEGEYNGKTVSNFYPREIHVSIFGEMPQGGSVQDHADVDGVDGERIDPDSFYAERVFWGLEGQEKRETLTLAACGIHVTSLTNSDFVLSLPAMKDQEEIVIHDYTVLPEADEAVWDEGGAATYAPSAFLLKDAWPESSTLLEEKLHNAVVYARFEAEAGQKNPTFILRKIDREGQSLAGAAYRLEEKLADGSLRLIRQDESKTDGFTFVYEALAPGDYLLTETLAPEGYVLAAPQEFTVTEENTVLWWGTPEAFRYAMYTLTGVKPEGEVIWITHKEVGMLEEPSIVLPAALNLKTNDMNDSDPAQDAVVWEDSADYDIGDHVPFRLEAKLTSNVSSFRRYSVVFADTMEAGLTNLQDYTVMLVRGGKEIPVDASFVKVLSQDEHSFRLQVEWGDGTAFLPHDLNGALVRVYFHASLNKNLTVGERGNVNTAHLEYTLHPSQANAEKKRTEEDKAIVFSYQLRFGKVDEEGKPLAGAAFKLEKVIAPRKEGEEETLREMPLDKKASTKTDFVFTGLDDGDYILTETHAPFGYLKAEPIRFTVTAAHAAEWDGKDETRAKILTHLEVTKKYGDITLTASLAKGVITGDRVVDVSAEEFEFKTRDINDTLGPQEGEPWVDSADYDRGDSVPFRIRLLLPDNVSAYSQYRMTVTALLPEGLTNNKDYKAVILDKEYTDFTAEEDENGFVLTFLFDGKEELLPEEMDKAEVVITYTATLNDKSLLGEAGNISAASAAFARAGDDEDEKEIVEETGWDAVYTYTYALLFNKVDDQGRPLTGAAFKLEKMLADGTAQEMPLDQDASSGDVFFFPGLDDGTYVLSETAEMAGFLPSDPAVLVITAEHAPVAEEAMETLLLSLDVSILEGDMTAEADKETGVLSGTFMNVREREILFETADINDTLEKELTWQNTADHDIGDSVPFRVTTALPGNISAYGKYEFVFVAALDPGLTSNRDYAATLNGQPFTALTARETEAGFEVTLTFDGGEENLPDTLAGQEVTLTFTARLNEKAVLGETGNLCTLKLRYPESPRRDAVAETKSAYALIYTYGLTVNKVNDKGEPLSGASFRLEKILLDGTAVEVLSSVSLTTPTSFVFPGLDDGDYVLTESRAPSGWVPAEPVFFTVSAEHAPAWDGVPESRPAVLSGLSVDMTSAGAVPQVSKETGLITVALTNVPAPKLSHAVMDKNDSAAKAAPAWVTSADYDEGDKVPLRIVASLVDNVSSFTRYHVTLSDTLEKGLVNNRDYQVTLNGEPVTDYTVKDTDQGFDLTIHWGDGTAALPKSLNGAEVIVYYTATLTSEARTGSPGNLSAARMRYSIGSSEGAEGEIGESRVLVFTYKLRVASVDETGKMLDGAAFTLKKKLEDGTLRLIAEDVGSASDAPALFPGLDDGDYVLTQTKTPGGYLPADEMSFSIRADHTAGWNGDLYTRTYVLTSLNGVKTTGAYDLTANKTTGELALNVPIVPKPVFEKKVDDMNDSANNEDAVEWTDSADGDIGDNMRFLLRTKLPANLTSYEQYHLTFIDTMEAGLTNNRDYRVTVNGNAAGFKVLQEDEHSFEIILTLSKNDLTEKLAGAEVLVYYTARLNENAWVGGEGNVNTALMRYPDSPNAGTETETEKQRAVVFTYRFTVTKADESGKPLAGAAFKLEKVLSNGAKKQIPLDVNTSTETAFSFRGLDDGRYILTETKAPAGYLLAAPLEFVIDAQHNAEWNSSLASRAWVLTAVSANTDSTTVNIRCDSETMNLRATIIDERSSDAPAGDQPGGYKNRFSFTKVWLGDVEDSIDFNLYNPNGSVRRKSFKKTKVSDTEYLYEAWFADWSEFYVIEEPIDGYKVRYENVGAHAGETDRCYNGGRIINYKVPKTGDETNIGLWIGLTAASLCGLGVLAFFSRRRRKAGK